MSGGFWIALPRGWVSLDVDPRTSAVTARRLVAAAADADETIRANQAAIEQILVGAARDATADGIRYCAAYYEQIDDNLAVQASLSVGIHGSTEGTDPSAMLRGLADDSGRRISIVDLDAGQAVCRTGIRHTHFPGTEEPLDLLTHQYFIPVPSTTDLLTAVAFASPTLALQDELVALFDTIAQTFAFTT
jgi:hypothetical protein